VHVRASTRACARACKQEGLCTCVQARGPVHVRASTRACARACKHEGLCTCVQAKGPVHVRASKRARARACKQEGLCMCAQARGPVHLRASKRVTYVSVVWPMQSVARPMQTDRPPIFSPFGESIAAQQDLTGRCMKPYETLHEAIVRPGSIPMHTDQGPCLPSLWLGREGGG